MIGTLRMSVFIQLILSYALNKCMHVCMCGNVHISRGKCSLHRFIGLSRLRLARSCLSWRLAFKTLVRRAAPAPACLYISARRIICLPMVPT